MNEQQNDALQHNPLVEALLKRLISRIFQASDMSLPDATDVEVQLVRMISELTALRARVSELTTQLAEASNERDDDRNIVKEMDSQIKPMRVHCEEEKSRADGLAKELEEVKKQYGVAQLAVDFAQPICDELNKDLRDLKQQLAAKTAEVEELTAQYQAEHSLVLTCYDQLREERKKIDTLLRADKEHAHGVRAVIDERDALREQLATERLANARARTALSRALALYIHSHDMSRAATQEEREVLKICPDLKDTEPFAIQKALAQIAPTDALTVEGESICQKCGTRTDPDEALCPQCESEVRP